MKTCILIEWDKPDNEDWLCPENIELALSSYCKNTRFKVTKIKPSNDLLICKSILKGKLSIFEWATWSLVHIIGYGTLFFVIYLLFDLIINLRV